MYSVYYICIWALCGRVTSDLCAADTEKIGLWNEIDVEFPTFEAHSTEHIVRFFFLEN